MSGETFPRTGRLVSWFALLLLSFSPLHAADETAISDADMQRVYEEVKTPFKYGIVLRPGEDELVDCPSVFRYEGKWYMVYVANKAKVGYETLLAESGDLLNWKPLGKILPFAEKGWDAWQGDGGIALVDPTWGGSMAPETFDGKYWLSYIGGAQHGYEPDPLAIGLAWSTEPNRAEPWTRLPENPVLATTDADVRPFESVTLYKSTIIRDPEQRLGAPFVMYYNGKTKQGNHEAIGMAISHDLRKWQRYGREPVVDNAPGKPAISGDPQIVKIGDLWVMFYFGFRWKPKAFDTFAVSRDLVHWTKWQGPDLVEPTEPWDKPFAHKPWLLKHDGVVYHYYCATGKEGRVIALATSKDLRPSPSRSVSAVPTLNPGVGPSEFWVALDGDDRKSGSKGEPLRTLAMALRKVRELRRTQGSNLTVPIHIYVRGGTYALTEPIVVRAEDTGTAESPTIVESAPGEHAILSGGVKVTGWTTTSTSDGISAIGRGVVMVAAAPLANGRPVLTRELWVNGRKATRARTGNERVMDRLVGWDRIGRTASIPLKSLNGLRTPDAVEMVVEQQWEIAILRVREIQVAADTAKLGFHAPESAIEFQHPWPQPILPPQGGGAFFLTNAIEFLDSPGEWYQDRATGRIYYWPRADEKLSEAEVVVPARDTLVEVTGTLDRPVEHVQFRNLGFAHAAWNDPDTVGHVPLQAGMPLIEAYKISPPGTPDKKGLENQAWIRRMPAAVKVVAANKVVFDHCTFEHTGATALDLRHGVRGATIEGCTFRDIGGNGIQIGSFQEGAIETHVPYLPVDDREICVRIRVANNVLRDTANVDWGCVAIISGYAREVTIEHNDIADTSYTGISVGWGWTPTVNASRANRIHANRIRRIATRLCDTAGVYTLSAQAGTIVSENVVDDVTISPYVDRPDHWFYLYTDEGSSNITVRDNWTPADKFLKNANGPGNTWENNGPAVSAEIKQRAGVEPTFRDLVPVDPPSPTVTPAGRTGSNSGFEATTRQPPPLTPGAGKPQ